MTPSEYNQMEDCWEKFRAPYLSVYNSGYADGSREERAKNQTQIMKLSEALKAVLSLIEESDGVTGLHLNGDVATWGELRTGGRFEGWLMEFDEAVSLI